MKSIGDCLFGLVISALLFTQPEMVTSCASFMLGWFGTSLVLNLLERR